MIFSPRSYNNKKLFINEPLADITEKSLDKSESGEEDKYRPKDDDSKGDSSESDGS